MAHEAAADGRLPPDFNQWDLADKNGWTVAHVVAEHGILPPDFNQWSLKGKDGRTVADIIRRKGLEFMYPSLRARKTKKKQTRSAAPGM